jgi:glycosidase
LVIWRRNPKGKKFPPNNGNRFCGKGWELDERTGYFYYHMFTKQQPDLNWRNPEVYAEMMDTVQILGRPRGGRFPVGCVQ